MLDEEQLIDAEKPRKRAYESDHIPAAAGFHYRGGDRLRLYVWEIGDSSFRGTVVLLHGLLTSHATWSDVASRLAAAGWRVMTPDLLGFGESPWPRGASSYKVDRHIEELVKVLRPLQTRIHLVGHSVGAILAAELVARRAELGLEFVSLTTIALPYFESSLEARRHLAHVTRCCCCSGFLNAAPCAPQYRRTQDQKNTSSWRASLVWILLNFPILSFVLCSLICQQRNVWFFFARLFGGKPFEQRFKNVLLHSYHSVVATYTHCVERHHLDMTKLVNIRVLVAHGRADDVIAPDRAVHFHTALSEKTLIKPTLVLLDGVKHSCSDSAPVIADLLLQWLSRKQHEESATALNATLMTETDGSQLQTQPLASAMTAAPTHLRVKSPPLLINNPIRSTAADDSFDSIYSRSYNQNHLAVTV